MLSIAKVSSGAAAAKYYEQADDYYTSDRSPSLWSGGAAAELGLEGPVRPDDFRSLLDGRLPSGEQLHNGGSGRRGATDLTFSAPKSVSIQALVAGDVRLLQAHEAAVTRALEHAETLAACRVTQHGETTRQTTGKLAVAQFRHELSRAEDPQVHTHCVAVNVTLRHDGQWRSLDSEPLYRHKMLLGALYRSELARELKTLGYEIRVTHGDGRFELSHISSADLKVFSRRANQMDAALQRHGISRERASARQLQVIALQTREAKRSHDRTALHANWMETAQAAGLLLETRVVPRQPDHQRDAHYAAQSVNFAISHLTEREAVMSRADIERAALERGVGQTHLAPIRASIAQAEQRGDLIRTGEYFTTPGAQQREREILALEAAGRRQVAPLMDRDAVQAALVGRQLNADQRLVVHHLLTTKDRVTGVQGRAGTGKTTTLRAVHDLACSKGVKLIGIAPSAGAARELATTGIQSQTIALLRTRSFSELNSNTLLVVDEAGMVSARDMHSVLKAADTAGARVVLVGDSQQLKAVEAGKPFSQLQAAGMSTASLQLIQRQQDPQLKAAVELAADGLVRDSLQRLDHRVVEIEGHPSRHAQIAADYASLPIEQREVTLILAGTNLARESINTEVRSRLGLTGQGVEVTTLSSKHLTTAQAQRTVSYQADDVVCADRDYKSLGLSKGELARVVEGRAGVVTLQLEKDARRVEWRPVNQPHMSAFTQHRRELAVGDLVRFTRNDLKAGIVNGDRATVAALDMAHQRLILEKPDGNRVVQSMSTPLYLDHGYTQTVHASQGQTCQRVLIESPTSGMSGNESQYYVAISRATHEARIYTDDKERLPDALSREDRKTAALDIGHSRQEIASLSR